MAKQRRKTHSVKGSLTLKELTRAGSSLNLELYANRSKIGELVIGQGSLYWWGRGRKTRKRLRWSKFAAMMDTLAYGTK
jgi:hypothetical protein